MTLRGRTGPTFTVWSQLKEKPEEIARFSSSEGALAFQASENYQLGIRLSASEMKRLAPQETRTYFVSITTHQRRSLFQSDRLATLFLDLLKSDRDRGRYKFHELVLMPNHVHLIITPAYEVSLEKAVQFIKGGFSFRVKKEMGSNLEIWQPGFNSHNIQRPRDYEAHRTYIYNNAVLAKLVQEPQEYPYSSANPSIKALIDDAPPWLKPEVVVADSAGLKASAPSVTNKTRPAK